MAKHQNTYAKRSREAEKKRKADQKRQRRAERKQDSPATETDTQAYTGIVSPDQ